MDYKDTNPEVDKSKFQFVQRDEKIFDKKFETKPVGYFKDAMIRFVKNKTNVVATVILFTLITLSILIPTFTSKNYTTLEPRMAFLPPRVPVIENFGMLDGTVYVENQQIVTSTIDPDTGLGIPDPTRYPTDYINMDTLINYDIACSEVSENCSGGEVNFANREADSASTFKAPGNFFPALADLPFVTVDVSELQLSDGSTLSVLVNDGSGNYVSIGDVTDVGEQSFDIIDAVANPDDVFFYSTELRFLFENSDPSDYVRLNAIELSSNASTDPLYVASGYDLATFETLDGTGRLSRFGATITMSSFEFDAYGAALGDYRIDTFSKAEYEEIVQSHGDSCSVIDNPDNPEGWYLSEGCPVREVVSTSEPVVVDGVEYTSYEVIMNYGLYAGYDEVPYYLAGTTNTGRDLFNLAWVALRTSLLIGVSAALVNITIGIIYGAISGYYGGKIDILMERFSEIIARIPFLVVLAIAVAYIGPGITTLFIVLIVSGWIGVASVTRTQFYRYKGREYVLASRTLGAKDSRLIFRHILPNGVGTIITASILSIPLVIFTESTLSYLGFGIGHGQSFNLGPIEFSGVSIGVLLADGRAEIISRPYLTIWPAVIISILMITFNLFGNALRDAFNPSLRGSE